MKTCEDLMTPNPICCLPTDTVRSVGELMKNGNIGSIPVIDNSQSKKLIGIITDRDLAIKVIGQGRDPNTTLAEAVMTRKVVSCRPDDELQLALNAMSENQLRRIVIVDNVNKILGIISQADIATRGNQPQETAKIVKDISQSTSK